MSDAKVKFLDTNGDAPVAAGGECMFIFTCPRTNRCGALLIAGRNPEFRREPQGHNGGAPMWDWDGNREAPTFSPSIDCKGCWHGYIRAGRCVDVRGKDEP